MFCQCHPASSLQYRRCPRHILSVYRYSESTQMEEFTHQVLDNVDLKKPTIILGDINIDLFKHENNVFSRELKNLGFVQLVKQATHLSGGLLDHIYVYIPLGGCCQLFKVHPLYYSDHDAVCCILEFPSWCSIIICKLLSCIKWE